jgi:hypothetical protein
LKKFSKFMYAFIIPFLIISPNSIIPSTAYMYKNQ